MSFILSANWQCIDQPEPVRLGYFPESALLTCMIFPWKPWLPLSAAVMHKNKEAQNENY
jgi:hypothetical protein